MSQTYKVTDPKTGKTLRLTGDSPPTEQELNEIFSQFEVKPERSFGEKVGGAFDAAATMATGALAQPVAGLAGLARTITAGTEAGAQRVEDLQQRLTYKPGEVGQEYLQGIAEAPIIKQIGETAAGASEYAGRKTFDITGSPIAASVARGLPEAAGVALGAYAPGGVAARQASKAADVAQDGANALVRSANLTENIAGSSTAKALRSMKKSRIREIVDADPKFYQALDELGITAEPLPSYASRNPQFRGIEQSFAALPNSPQNAQSLVFARDVSNVAHALLETAEGAGNSVGTSLKWRDASMTTIKELGRAADDAYDSLNQVLDRRAPAEPVNTMQFLDDFAKDLALGIDDPDVPAVIKRAYASLQPRRVETDAGVQLVPATLENMDRLRKNIGAAAFKNQGDFKDADSALLKRLYSSLTDDINEMAAKQGFDVEVGAAKALVSQRKQLEEGMQTLLGNNLQKDIIPVVQQGLQGLRKGGAQRYREVMSNIPEPEVRQELIMTALDDMFSKTARGEKQFGTLDYLKWYNDTLKNKSVRQFIEADLPAETMKALDNLAAISEGVARATAQRIPTGVVNSVLNDNTGFVSKMMGITAKGAGRTLQATPMMQETGTALINMAAGRSKRADSVRDLLAEPEFANMIRRGVAQGVTDGKKATESIRLAESRLKRTASYKAWEQTLTESERAKLAGSGLAAFLLSQKEYKND
jgi:histone H3/H4